MMKLRKLKLFLDLILWVKVHCINLKTFLYVAVGEEQGVPEKKCGLCKSIFISELVHFVIMFMVDVVFGLDNKYLVLILFPSPILFRSLFGCILGATILIWIMF